MAIDVARRYATLLLVALPAGFVTGQTVLASALQDLKRYFGAASALLAGAVAGINGADASRVAETGRAEVRSELERISQAISDLRARQEPLAFELSEYVDKVRSGELVGERRERAWRSVLRGINTVSPIVRTTLEVVEASRWLKVTLDAHDRLALREVLLGRVTLLSRFRDLPEPASAAEIDELERLVDYYAKLRQSLSDLNAALLDASQRLRLG